MSHPCAKQVLVDQHDPPEIRKYRLARVLNVGFVHGNQRADGYVVTSSGAADDVTGLADNDEADNAFR